MSDSNLPRHTTRRPHLMLLTGHSAPVVAAAFSPDGQLLATGSYDHTIVLWDTASGAMLRRLSGHRESVGPLAFSADGETLASAGYGTVRLWNVRTGRTKRVIDGYSGPLLFASDSTLLAFAEEEAVWLDVRTGQPVRTISVSLDDRYSPPRAAVSLDGSTMATAIYRDGTVLVIWDLKAGELKRRRGFPPRIPRKVRDWATGRLKTIYSNQTESLESLALSPDGHLLAVAGASSRWICSALTGRRTRLLVVGDRGPGSLAFSADGRSLASGFADGSVKLWSVPSGELLWSASGHSSWVSTLAFTPDGQLLASGSHDKTIRLWRTTTGVCLRKLPALEFEASTAAYSPDGAIIASGHEDSTVRLWHPATGELIRTIVCRYPLVEQLGFSPDGTALTSLSYPSGWPRPTGAVEDWSPGTGGLKHSVLIRRSETHPVPFSPCPQIQVACVEIHGSDRTVLEWQGPAGAPPRRGNADVWAFAPHGRLVATTLTWEDKGKIKLWDTLSGDLVREMGTPKTPDAFVSLLFSADGKTLAAGYFGFRLGLWDVDSGRFLWEGRTDEDTISSLAFSPEDSLVASAGGYGQTVELWDLQIRRRKATLKGHTNHIRSVAISPDGRKVVTASADGTLRLWEAATGRLLATLMVLPSTGGEISQDWITFTPEGYYHASPGAARFIRWRAGATVYDAEQFESRFHRPDMSKEALR